MANTSAEALAGELLNASLQGEPWSRPALDALIRQSLSPATATAASRALFGILVEGLSDRFSPALCVRYAELFSPAVAAALPSLRATALQERYQRVREVCPWRGPDPAQVFVLSRVTLGADIAVTSVLLDAVKRRFPRAIVYLVGGRKVGELFGADPRVRLWEAPYPRAADLKSRLQVSAHLADALADAPLVVDPDSRLSQTGLVPLCREDRYLFWESRSYKPDSSRSLTELASDWAAEVFGVAAQPYLPLPAAVPRQRTVTISLGVAENEAKRLGDAFEADLLRLAGERDWPIYVDEGGSEAEANRVREAIRASGLPPAQCSTVQGSFAEFVARIASSSLYLGYDSAGQHAASVLKTPLVTVFAGYPNARFLQRWRPQGEVVAVPAGKQHSALAEVGAALSRLALR